MFQLTLIRHGALKDALPGSCYGFTDYKLSEEGERQALMAACALKGEKFDRIYYSPLTRTRRTLDLICGDLGFDSSKAIPDDRLREMDHGILEGYSRERVLKEYPAIHATMESDWMALRCPGGETALGFYARVNDFFAELGDSFDGSALVICHGGTIRAAICGLLGLDPVNAFWRFRLGHCCIVKLCVSDGWGMLTQLSQTQEG